MTGAQSIEYTNKNVIVRSYLITLAIFQSAHADLVSCFAVKSLFFSTQDFLLSRQQQSRLRQTEFQGRDLSAFSSPHTFSSSIFHDKGEFSCDCDGCCKRVFVEKSAPNDSSSTNSRFFTQSLISFVREKLKLFPQQRLMLNF